MVRLARSPQDNGFHSPQCRINQPARVRSSRTAEHINTFLSCPLFRVLILILTFAPRSGSQAQTPGLSDVNIDIRRITPELGLGNVSVNCFAQDREGFIWIGTGSGLYRYDGLHADVYREGSDSTSLTNSVVWSLCADREGFLWVGTDHGLNRFDPATGVFKQYIHDPRSVSSLGNDIVRSLYEDRDGVLWVGTEWGLNRFERSTGSWRQYLPSPGDTSHAGDNFISVLLEDREGVFWVGAGGFLKVGGGLYRFDKETGAFVRIEHGYVFPDPAGNWVTSILEDASGTIWVGANGDYVNKFDRKSGRFEHIQLPSKGPRLPGSLAVKTILEDEHGVLWVAAWVRSRLFFRK